MIYCDHNATTAVRPEVAEAMLPFLSEAFGNASSVHALGSRSRCAVEEARAHVAALIGARPQEIIFTSGGTESNHLAVAAVVPRRSSTVVVTTPIEHASIRETVAAWTADGGGRVVEWAVDEHGRIDSALADTMITPGVDLVSIGWANNEIGTVQPIEAVGKLCRERRVWLHSDAVQAAGKIPVNTAWVDMLSLSAHKLGGPKGVGALFVRDTVPFVPLLRGGGQERGRRAGTENVAGIVGMGEACRLAATQIATLAQGCVVMREALWGGLSAIPGAHRLSPVEGCLPNTLCVRFDGVRGEALVAALDLAGIAVSAGSACASGAGEPSHVLQALGLPSEQARDGVRFSFGRGNAPDDSLRVAAAAAESVARIRRVHGERAVA